MSLLKSVGQTAVSAIPLQKSAGIQPYLLELFDFLILKHFCMEGGVSCYLHLCLAFQVSWEELILIFFLLILTIVTVFLAKSPVSPDEDRGLLLCIDEIPCS